MHLLPLCSLPYKSEETYHDPDMRNKTACPFLSQSQLLRHQVQNRRHLFVCLTLSHAKITKSKQNSTVQEKRGKCVFNSEDNTMQMRRIRRVIKSYSIPISGEL
jgi:hypothetical protein